MGNGDCQTLNPAKVNMIGITKLIKDLKPGKAVGPRGPCDWHYAILLTSILCKILKQIVLINLLAKVDKCFYNRQHGFRRGLSYETPLRATLNEISSFLNRHNCLHAAILDLRHLTGYHMHC